jgi:cytochrome c biogenesis protein CcmG, thiol:disulfide interchange protein DsbE
MRLAVAALLLLVAGCGTPEQEEGSASGPNPFASEAPAPASDVQVDTRRLRTLKEKAGIADCPRVRPAEEVAGGLPDVTLPCLGGGPDVQLAGLAGKPTVINLWASWCAPCREELPILQEYAQRAQGRVAVIGVDFQDMRPEAALELARRSGVTYPQLADVDAELKQAFRVQGMPWTVVVDAEGRVVHTLTGQIHSVEELDEAVESAVGVSVDG